MPSCYALDTERLPLTILLTDSFIASALIRQGPSTGITMQTLNFYHIACQCNPHFSIQAYVKMLCDLQGIICLRFNFTHICFHQFSIALNMYLQILFNIKSLVHKVIRCTCTYTLKDEDTLQFRLLYMMDGNNSLNFTGDFPVDMLSLDDKENLCAGRWNNMKDKKTRRMWGIFDESGIFMAVCRHGFSLVIADMVQSGKQSKYPLVVVSKLLEVFGKDLGGGYDIGCSVLGQSAQELNHTLLISAFHGHAYVNLTILLHMLKV
ncbi:hypothetical protein F4604DRAFT_1878930 [Suillus subluteus]|nr:hypothetical protein F4604DRAFT_1878930 [Suillus subluteus]